MPFGTCACGRTGSLADPFPPGASCLKCEFIKTRGVKTVAEPGRQWILDAKADSGKPPLMTILHGWAPALKAVAEVSKYGYHKHTARARERLIAEGTSPADAAARVPYNNWRNGDPEVYGNSAMNHGIDEGVDGLYDPESGFLHEAHRAWNSLSRLTLLLLGGAPLRRPGVDPATTGSPPQKPGSSTA